MNAALIEAIDVVKFLGEGAGRVEALRGVTVSLNAGELTLLMGPSGSGKTTLLSILGCILSPTSGIVRILGRSITGVDAEELAALRRKHVGFIFQTHRLFPTLTAAENVRLALDIGGQWSRKSQRKAEAALTKVGLAHKVKAFPRELSTGEQQRVAVARAVVGNASVILADEPTAALDGANGQAIMTLLAAIAKEASRAVLVVTHDPRIVPFADRIVRIEDGRIVYGEESTAPT
jgi:putative ABC transport system ATP-binding protein